MRCTRAKVVQVKEDLQHKGVIDNKVLAKVDDNLSMPGRAHRHRDTILWELFNVGHVELCA